MVRITFSYGSLFILIAKGKEGQVLNSLRTYEHIRSKVETLEEYDDTLQKRIIASLAINSIGKREVIR